MKILFGLVIFLGLFAQPASAQTGTGARVGVIQGPTTAQPCFFVRSGTICDPFGTYNKATGVFSLPSSAILNGLGYSPLPIPVLLLCNTACTNVVTGISGVGIVTVVADMTSGAQTITLPTCAAGSAGLTINFKKTDATGNAMTLAGSGGSTVDGAASISVVAQWASRTLQCIVGNWYVL